MKEKLYLLFLDLAFDGGDLDLHLLNLMLRECLDVRERIRVILSLEAQISQRDVPLTLILLMFPEKHTEKCLDVEKVSSRHYKL